MNEVEIKYNGRKYQLHGWIPSSIQKEDPQAFKAQKLLVNETNTHIPNDASTLPKRVDLQPYFPNVYDQGEIGSCTANAAAGALEYYQKRWYQQNKGLDYSKTPSRLFIYKHNRYLMGIQNGDVGATIKHTMQALHRFGAPEEDSKYGTEYDPRNLDKGYEPVVYALADDFKVDAWYNYDGVGRSQEEILWDVKRHLAVGQPVLFGFIVYRDAITDAARGGYIKPPNTYDSQVGGHAVLAAGYDDAKGALIIRNSWGEDWGDRGYGYLDYDYVRRNLAGDFWSIIKIDMFSEIDFEE